LRDKGVKVEDLAVIGLSSTEQLIGELITSQSEGEEKTLTGPLKLRNPKRFLRMQQMTEQGLAIQFMIGDLDMMDSGTVQVRGTFGYMLEDMGVEGQTSMLKLYLDMIQRKHMNRAREAGLHLPAGLQPTRSGLR